MDTTNNGLTLVDFTAGWCGPCKALEPFLETIPHKFGVPVIKVDVDTNDQAVSDHSIMSVPTILLMKHGREIDRLVGPSPDSILQTLAKHLS